MYQVRRVMKMSTLMSLAPHVHAAVRGLKHQSRVEKASRRKIKNCGKISQLNTNFDEYYCQKISQSCTKSIKK